MQGILVLSHGELAKGLVNTAEFILGKDIPQIGYCCVEPNEKPQVFEKRVIEKWKELNSGNGVIVLIDVLGGSTYKGLAKYLNSNDILIAGANLSVLLEILIHRMDDDPIKVDEIVQKGRDSIIDVKTFITRKIQPEE